MPTSDQHRASGDARPHRRNMGREPRPGNTVLLFGICSIAIVLIVGLSVDHARLEVARAELQQRLDRALVAGARTISGLRSETAVETFDHMPTGSVLRPMARRFEDDAAGLTGTVSAAVPTTLSSILGIRSIRITATGRAEAPALRCLDPVIGERDRAGCAVTAETSTRTTPQC